jgi:branched-chain amino acid transport system substrate-binding protein
MNVLVDAMKRADSSDPARYMVEIGKTDMPGVTGQLRFDARGDIAGGAVTLYQVKDGKWTTLETVQSGTTK